MASGSALAWTLNVTNNGPAATNGALVTDTLPAGVTFVWPGQPLPRGAEDDVWALTEGERRALGMKPLPSSLNQAIQAMERSELVAETLGEHVFDFFLRNKQAEWEEYRRQVTQWELDRYLPLL